MPAMLSDGPVDKDMCNTPACLMAESQQIRSWQSE